MSFLIAVLAVTAACAPVPPYRIAEAVDPSCRAELDAARSDSVEDMTADIDKALGDSGRAKCWMNSVERHSAYDLYTVEFDDQGWWAGESKFGAKPKELTALTNGLSQYMADGVPLSVVLFTHGWHHSAKTDDKNVVEFRMLLEGMDALEKMLCETKRGLPEQGNGKQCTDNEVGVKYWDKKRRVVGVYVGWRGDSVEGPLIEDTSIWDRKLAAEKVALGATQELFAVLHDFYREHGCHAVNSSWRCVATPDVRMLTIGHSFGGLINFRALATRLMTAIVEQHREGGSDGPPYAYSYGDLSVLINPAFEGTRFEPLANAAVRRAYQHGTAENGRTAQLPVLVVAQSEGDWATEYAFPAFRTVTTLAEHTEGSEREPNIHTVGWLSRYQTHRLSLDAGVSECRDWDPNIANRRNRLWNHVNAENQRVQDLRCNRYREFGGDLQLCGKLHLKHEPKMPFSPVWVIKTDEKVIKDHNDVLNPNFQIFIRQIYQSVLRAEDDFQVKAVTEALKHCEHNPSDRGCDEILKKPVTNLSHILQCAQ